MKHLGDFNTSAAIYAKFTTYSPSTGAPAELGGGSGPSVVVYKDGSTTQSSAGVTLTTNFDGIAGLNHVAIDTSADGTFYSSGGHFEIVIANGTVGGVEVVGACVASFDLLKTIPTIVDLVWDEVLTAATHNVATSAGRRLRQIASLAITDSAVNDAAATTTSFVTSLTSAVDNFYNDQLLIFTSGALTGQAKPILDYNGTTKAVTIDEGFTSAPANGDAFTIQATHIHPIAQIVAGVDSGTNLLAIKAKTDNLPTDPADESLIIAATDAIMARLGVPAGASVSADVAAVLTSVALRLLTSAYTAPLDAAGTRTAVGLAAANLDTQLGTLATAAALATTDGKATAIKAKTDSLAFTVAGQVDANVQYVNDVQITGNGAPGTEWGPV